MPDHTPDHKFQFTLSLRAMTGDGGEVLAEYGVRLVNGAFTFTLAGEPVGLLPDPVAEAILDHLFPTPAGA